MQVEFTRQGTVTVSKLPHWLTLSDMIYGHEVFPDLERRLSKDYAFCSQRLMTINYSAYHFGSPQPDGAPGPANRDKLDVPSR